MLKEELNLSLILDPKCNWPVNVNQNNINSPRNSSNLKDIYGTEEIHGYQYNICVI